MIREIIEHRELIGNLVARELKSRYKGSVLGFLWSLLTPLFYAVIYFVFLRMLTRSVSTREIIIGVFAWQFTVICIQGGMNAVTANANLVKKVFFPRFLLPLSVTLANLVNFLLTLCMQFVLLFAIWIIQGEALSRYAPAILAVIVYHTVFNTGLALMLSALNVYFRDTQHLVGVLTVAWFFMSPAMYNLELVRQFTETRPWVMNLYMLNPMAPVITAYRALILPDAAFPWTPWAVAGLLWPLLFTVLAYRGFQAAQKNFADML